MVYKGNELQWKHFALAFPASKSKSRSQSEIFKMIEQTPSFLWSSDWPHSTYSTRFSLQGAMIMEVTEATEVMGIMDMEDTGVTMITVMALATMVSIRLEAVLLFFFFAWELTSLCCMLKYLGNCVDLFYVLKFRILLYLSQILLESMLLSCWYVSYTTMLSRLKCWQLEM